jgi:hypothetical protein
VPDGGLRVEAVATIVTPRIERRDDVPRASAGPRGPAGILST